MESHAAIVRWIPPLLLPAHARNLPVSATRSPSIAHRYDGINFSFRQRMTQSLLGSMPTTRWHGPMVTTQAVDPPPSSATIPRSLQRAFAS